jgi:polyhydroxybutyrate depolymerase
MADNIDRLIRFSDKSLFPYRGIDRSYLHYLPTGYSKDRSWPLVLVLHGGGANGENAMRMADMEPLADREGFILLYPDGTGRPGDRVFTWNAGRCCAYALETNADDSGFLAALIDHFIAEHGADPRRVYVAGLSNGAMMAHRVAAEHSDRIAAIAPVAGGFNVDGVADPQHPVSVIAFHGLLDRHAPYAGGTGEKSLFKRVDRPVREGMELWARWNGCLTDPDREDQAAWTRESWVNGRGGSEVVLYTLKDQAHVWPGGRPGLRYGNADEPGPEPRATELIWEFFKAHPQLEDLAIK